MQEPLATTLRWRPYRPYSCLVMLVAASWALTTLTLASMALLTPVAFAQVALEESTDAAVAGLGVFLGGLNDLPAMAPMVVFAVGGAIVQLVWLPYLRARREVTVGPGGLALVRHHRWWAPRRSWHTGWQHVERVVERGFVRDPAIPQRPVLEVHLLPGAPELPRWVVGRTPQHVLIFGNRGKHRRPGARLTRCALDIGAVVREVHPDLVEAWVGESVAPNQLRHPSVGPDHQGHAPRALPGTTITSGALHPPPGPVWLSFTMERRRWWSITVVFTVLTALSGTAYLISGEVLGIFSLMLFIPLAAALVWWSLGSKLLLARRGVEVGPEGLTFVQERHGLVFRPLHRHVSWADVGAMVTREVRNFETLLGKRDNPIKPEMRSRNARRRVVDLYVRPTPWERGWADLQVDHSAHPVPDLPQMADAVEFPASRLRLEAPAGREIATFPSGWDSQAFPSEGVSHWQLRRVLYAFRPDLCHGFDDLTDPPNGQL